MSRTPGRGDHGLLVLGAVAYACFTFTWFSLAAFLAPLIAELGLSTTEAGLLVGAVPLVYVPLGLASGVLIDRIGSRVAIGVALAAFGLAQVVRAFAGDFLGLLVPTLVLGVAGTAITFGLPKLVAELFPPGRAGAMSTVYQVGALAGPAAVFGLARPVLGPLFGGWRPFFLASGAFVLGYAALWALAVVVHGRWSTRRAREAGHPEGTAAAADAGTSGGTAAGGEAFSVASVRRDLRRLLGHRDMRLLVVVGTMYLFVNHGLRGWLPVVLETRGVDPAVAGPATSLLIVGQLGGTLVIPPLSDRWNRRRAAVAASGALCVVGTAGLLAGPTSLPAVVAVIGVAGVGLGGLSPMLKVIPIDTEGVGPALTATAVGLVYAIGQVGGFAGPVVIGALFDATGSFATGLGVLLVASAVVVAASTRMAGVD